MRVLVTGSAGHLGEALVRVLRADGVAVRGLDLLASPTTDLPGSLTDRALVRTAVHGVDAVLHTATLHKPHVGSHRRQDFVDTNVAGTLALLEEAAEAGVGSFVFTSTTSAYGRALEPAEGAPAAWIDEGVRSVPKNIYGVTKTSAEDLCELVARELGLPTVVLRTSRFFPEQDDDLRDDPAGKVTELLHRRVDLADVVDAHRLALDRAPRLGFARYVISATTPFGRGDLLELRRDPAAVVRRLFPDQPATYAARGWSLPASISRVYVNARARAELGWCPRYDFRSALDRVAAGLDWRSPLAVAVGAKGYHAVSTGPYTRR